MGQPKNRVRTLMDSAHQSFLVFAIEIWIALVPRADSIAVVRRELGKLSNEIIHFNGVNFRFVFYSL